MDIRCNRNAEFASDVGEQFATVTRTRATKGAYRRAIRLVVGRLEDKLRAEVVANRFELARHPSSEGRAFDDARSENKQEVLPAKSVAADFYDTAGHWDSLMTIR
jgi:hypothetical protein